MSECRMSEYGTYYCYDCSRRMPRAEAHRDTIEIQSGRSSGGVGIGLRGIRFYSGRTYYRKKEIWLCRDCYLRKHPGQRLMTNVGQFLRQANSERTGSRQGSESKYLAALIELQNERDKSDRDKSERGSFALIATVIGGVAILLIVMLPILFGKSTDAAKPLVADTSVHADSTAVVGPLQGTNKLNPPPSDIMAAQNRLIELGFLKGPADGVWGAKSRMALRAFKIANGFTADDKWDDLVSGRLYSIQAARSPLPLATTSPAQ
jgi:hypothetical protein